ncbi:8396_t:CDS:2 [Dentiscutata erythropus]|uniref:8396_t:CDS:1 n=1 Tax=Dentiscutata erythropus TaxID=1348616 RepID=A0A9N9FHZ9_9GLOM|nr:8396_t:CDS:2 [Dentiscutata erythropus]
MTPNRREDIRFCVEVTKQISNISKLTTTPWTSGMWLPALGCGFVPIENIVSWKNCLDALLMYLEV